jgi:hypothetical protein
MSAKSEQLAVLIQDWLRQQNADYNNWSAAGFDCMKNCPEMLVAIDCVGHLEWRNSDGGLGQVFAETHPHWRKFLDLCEIGYRQIGASRHAERVEDVRTLFTTFEPEFSKAVDADMKAYEGGNDKFENVQNFKSADWVNGIGRDLDSQYFYSDEVVNLRNQWLETNEPAIRLAMIQVDLKRAEAHLQHVVGLEDHLSQLRELIERLSTKL